MIRVLFINHTLNFHAGGAERVLHDLVAGLDRARFHVALACPAEPAVASDEFERVADVVHDLPAAYLGVPPRTGAAVRTAGSLVRLNLAVAGLLGRVRPDVVYVNSIFGLHFAAIPARLARVPLVYHEHNLVSQRTGSLWHRGFRRLVRLATRVIAISESVRSELVGVGVDPTRIRTIHNGIRPAAVAPKDPVLPECLRRGGFVVGQVANFHAWKGHETVLRAVSRVRAEVEDARFLFLGGFHDPEYSDRMKRLAEDLAVAEHVEFAGYRPDAEALVPRLSCLVAASGAEPFGLVLLEAMRAGVAVVASAGGGVTEIVRDGVNGLLFPPGDSEALATCLIRLARDRELSARLVEGGREAVAGPFAVETQLAAVATAIQESVVT